MTNTFATLLIPCDSVNDETVKVVALPFKNGSHVALGAVVAEVETSKSVVELEAPRDGYFFASVSEHDSVAVGAIYGFIADSQSFDLEEHAKPEVAGVGVSSENNLDLKITEPALALINLHNVDISVFEGQTLVREVDVLTHLGKSTADKGIAAPDFTTERLFVHSSLIGDEEKTPSEVVIIGSGGHGAVIADILLHQPNIKVLGFSNNVESTVGSEVIGGYKVLCHQEQLPAMYPPERIALFVAIGNNVARFEVAERFSELGYRFANAIHATGYVALGAELGAGVSVMAGAIVGARAKIGDHSIINTNASVDHDCIIGRGVHIAPSAALGGRVMIGDRSRVGIGVKVNKDVAIGEDCDIASGFTVYRNVPEGREITPKLKRIWW